jgi:hypothetical protein
MSPQGIVPYAQISTAFVATAALGVATWSLLTQKAGNLTEAQRRRP